MSESERLGNWSPVPSFIAIYLSRCYPVNKLTDVIDRDGEILRRWFVHYRKRIQPRHFDRHG